jgi:two-component sensor histidine kinase/DNA-binding response OmpR family regulator
MASTILNVDDDEASRYMIGTTLRRSGFDVWEAGTGQLALDLAQKQPDLVLLDVNLPDMNGFEVCRKLKNDPVTASIPILHLSASRVDPDATVQGLEGGADGYLVHPVEPAVLVATINALLRAKKAELQWQTTFDSIRDGICLLDISKDVLKYNEAFQGMIQVGNEDLTRCSVYELLQQRSKDIQPEASNQDFHIGNCCYRMSLHDVKNGNGEMTGFVLTLTDITERKQAEETLQASLQEKEILLHEIHHRVKNNLQVIMSLLGLQSLQVTDSEALQILNESKARIKAMALIHENLYTAHGSAGVNLTSYLKLLTDQIVDGYSITKNIELKYVGEQVILDINKAVPIGLIINEILTNSLKYAYDDVSRGTLEVSLVNQNEKVEMLIRDNGRGLPSEEILQKSRTLGWKLINLLIKQLDGTLEILRDRPGANIRITF